MVVMNKYSSFAFIQLMVFQKAPWRAQEGRAACVVAHQSAGCQRARVMWRWRKDSLYTAQQPDGSNTQGKF